MLKPAVRTVSTTSTRITSKSYVSNNSTESRKKNRRNFALRYADLCQLQNLNQLSSIKQHLSKGVLDFNADRVKYEEWWTILNALSTDQTLHFVGIRSRHPTKFPLENVDTELKARSSSKQPVIKTRYVLTKLVESLRVCLTQSKALTVLEIEGLPLGPDYVAILCSGILQSTTIQHLSFYKSYIQDEGVDIICSTIKNLPSVVSLDLSYSGITSTGTDIIAGLIKYQKLNRYSETWKQTLRYRDPDVENMPGLRRITLNGNQEIRDVGVIQIAEEMKDDLWIRALDMQDCGLSDEGGKLLIELVQCNTNLVIVDIRGNPYVSQMCLAEMMGQLNTNHGDKPTEYQWISKSGNLNKKSCMVSTRPWSSTNRTIEPSECSVPSYLKLKRSQSTLISRDTRKKQESSGDIRLKLKLEENNKMQERLQELTTLLNQEIQKRHKLTEENEELKKKLEKCNEEKKKLKESEQNKLTIQHETLQLLESLVSKFGTFIHQDEDISEGSEVGQEDEVNEIMSSLKLLLDKADPTTDENKRCKEMYSEQSSPVSDENKRCKEQCGTKTDEKNKYKEEQKKRRNKCKWSNNENVIWEEDESTSQNDSGDCKKDRIKKCKEEKKSNSEKVKVKQREEKSLTKAQAMFATLLQRKNVNIKNESDTDDDSDYDSRSQEGIDEHVTTSETDDSSS